MNVVEMELEVSTTFCPLFFSCSCIWVYCFSIYIYIYIYTHTTHTHTHTHTHCQACVMLCLVFCSPCAPLCPYLVLPVSCSHLVLIWFISLQLCLINYLVYPSVLKPCVSVSLTSGIECVHPTLCVFSWMFGSLKDCWLFSRVSLLPAECDRIFNSIQVYLYSAFYDTIVKEYRIKTESERCLFSPCFVFSFFLPATWMSRSSARGVCLGVLRARRCEGGKGSSGVWRVSCPEPEPARRRARGRSPVKSAGRSKLKFVGRHSLKPATPNGSWKGFKYAKMLENCRIYRTILLKLFTFSQILQGVPKLSHATVFIYCRNLIYLTYGKIW